MEQVFIEHEKCVTDFINLCAKLEMIGGDIVKLLDKPQMNEVDDAEFYKRSIIQGILQLSHYATKIAAIELQAKINVVSTIIRESDE